MTSRGIDIGDWVGLIDGTEKGKVIRISGDRLWFETDEGFEIVAFIDKVVKYKRYSKKAPIVKTKSVVEKKTISSKNEFPVTKKPVIPKVKDQNFKIPVSSLSDYNIGKRSKVKPDVWEVDLHIEELLDDYSHLSNGEIVDIQVKHARRVMEKARKNKVLKVVFIHGKGKGVLRSELHHLLLGYTNIEFYDASFKKYGGGATEVRLFQQSK